MKKVLVADTLPPECTRMLEEAGLQVDYRPGLPGEELRAAVAEAEGVICRSGAQLSADVLEGAERLVAICRAGVGVDNIDVDAASRQGIVVMNTPGGNAVSTAEHTFALMLGLARNLGPAYLSMREGRWEKKRFVGSQLAGRTLGVVGLGRIGQEVAKRAIAFGMKVQAFDPLVSREVAARVGVRLVDSMEDLLAASDYLTVHVPENEQTRGLIGADQVAMMKEDACILNCARGSVVDQEAVTAAVAEGRLGGAAFDVYESEPPEDFSFARHDRVLTTPHLGASTQEAQLAVAVQAAEQLIDALGRRHFRNALNADFLTPEEMELLQPYCDLAVRLGKLVAQVNPARPKALEVVCKGELARENLAPVINHAVMGLMQWIGGEEVNIVSAPHLARERGIRVTSARTESLDAGFTKLVEVTLTTDDATLGVSGTVFEGKHPRIVRIGDFDVEIEPRGHVLIVFNNDMPGCIGTVGSALGQAGINVARMGVCRQQVGGNALLALNLDSPCDRSILDEIRRHELIQDAIAITL
ncbi:MAG: phosphoglycerate dehydrogenase [Planctomycetota bacterium]|jgi:D-3-phosphoglycerate dehydrogenase